MSNLRRLKRKKERRVHVSDGRYYYMTEEHADVLQNIEFALVSAFREDQRVDDRDVAAALRAAIAGEAPAEDTVESLVARLAGIRRMRADISDETWLDGLKVVLESVQRHSLRRRGDYDYLLFVENFLP